jgi:hypothetical protein
MTMARHALAEIFYDIEDSRTTIGGLAPSALTTTQLREVLREVLSLEPEPRAISTLFGSKLATLTARLEDNGELSMVDLVIVD